MIVVSDYRYVTVDSDILSGEPIIKSTRTPIRAIVELYRLGIAPEEITAHLPHLTLAQVFDALSFYADNSDLINSYILKNKIEEPDLALDA